MTKHLHNDMDYLHREILSLSTFVEDMIERAHRALCNAEADQAHEVIDMDSRVDQLEVSIEDDCLKILALHQPVAVDLRRIATVMKANNDLERIADLAVNIAERALALCESPGFPIPEKLGTMIEMAAAMVRDALNAFVNLDAALSREICARDDQVDQLGHEITDELVEQMQRKPEFVPLAINCFSATRYVERIADHATNIAEDVIYLVEGDIVRHQQGASSLAR
jgi:phosphate transport system protein